MSPKMKAQNVLVIGFILLFLSACSTTAKTPTPPPRPTQTPLPNISQEEILGDWQPTVPGKDAMYLQLNLDGTCRQSYTLTGLTNAPDVKCTYTLDGPNIVFADFIAYTVKPCAGKTVTYAIQMLAAEKMKMIPVDENCTPRRNSTAGEYTRAP